MKKRFTEVQNRRGLLVGALRYGTLGILGAVGGWAFAKRGRLIREGKCVNGGICRDCRVYERCGLPQALSAKQVLLGRKRGGK